MSECIDFKTSDVISSENCHNQENLSVELLIDGVNSDLSVTYINFKTKEIEIYVKDGDRYAIDGDEIKTEVISPASCFVRFQDGTIRSW